MSVINVVAKMSDLPVEKAKAGSAPAESGFDQVMQTAISDNTQTAAKTECAACAAAHAAAGSAAVDKTGEVVEPEINKSAMYRFTVFVRVSGDMTSLGQGLAEQFKSATLGFVNALLGEEEQGVEPLDGYLDQAEKSVSAGLESSKSFLDNMLNAADYGLKAITASMTGSSWMSSFGGSTSSSAMPSVSSADIAKLYLQDTLNKGATGSSSSSASAVSYGGGYQLKMVKGATEPLKIADAGEQAEVPAAVSSKDKILERFLQLIDDISGAVGGRVIKAGYSVSYYNSALSRDMEVEEPASAQVVPAVDASPAESVEADEEVLA